MGRAPVLVRWSCRDAGRLLYGVGAVDGGRAPPPAPRHHGRGGESGALGSRLAVPVRRLLGRGLHGVALPRVGAISPAVLDPRLGSRPPVARAASARRAAGPAQSALAGGPRSSDGGCVLATTRGHGLREDGLARPARHGLVRPLRPRQLAPLPGDAGALAGRRPAGVAPGSVEPRRRLQDRGGRPRRARPRPRRVARSASRVARVVRPLAVRSARRPGDLAPRALLRARRRLARR